MDGVALIPLLIQSLEKSSSQTSHVQQLTEAAALASVIARLLTADHSIPGL